MFPDLVKVIDSVAHEKNIHQEEIFAAIEESLKKDSRAKYGEEHDLHVEIDRKSGDCRMYRALKVVESPTDVTEIGFEDAKRRKPNVALGDVLTDDLPPFARSRISLQLVKQVLVQKIRDAERRQQYEEYKGRVGELVRGIVKRCEKRGFLVDLGRAEAFLPRDQTIPWEVFRMEDRLRAVISEVRQEINGPQIFLSRISDTFLARLVRQEISEVAEGLIEIKAVARSPGSNAKIAVFTRDPSLDPVGACIGRKGIKIQPLVNELQKEKIDVIPWSASAQTFLVNAFSPAEVTKIIFDSDKRFEVIVPDHELPKLLARDAQMLNLIRKLTGFQIDLLSESEASERQTKEFYHKSQIFMDALEVDSMFAHVLVIEKFNDIAEIAATPTEELAMIQGFNLDVATELRSRAVQYLEEQEQALENAYQDLQMDESIRQITQWKYPLLIKLGENEIKTRQNLADLSVDELAEMMEPENIERGELEKIILKAREPFMLP